MKNILTLILVCICSTLVGAQSKSSQENTRAILAKAMISFIESVKPAYSAGMSYESFQNLLTGGARPTAEGSTLIRKAHDFLSKKYSNQAILDNYPGLEMASAFVKLKSLNDSKVTDISIDLFTTSTGNFNPYQNKKPKPTSCYWYQMSCHIGDHYSEIVSGELQLICYISMLNGGSCN